MSPPRTGIDRAGVAGARHLFPHHYLTAPLRITPPMSLLLREAQGMNHWRQYSTPATAQAGVRRGGVRHPGEPLGRRSAQEALSAASRTHKLMRIQRDHDGLIGSDAATGRIITPCRSISRHFPTSRMSPAANSAEGGTELQAENQKLWLLIRRGYRLRSHQDHELHALLPWNWRRQRRASLA